MAPSGIFFLFFSLSFVNCCILEDIDVDIVNLPPPKVQPPANGSSRASGSILCRKAFRNVYNFGDQFHNANDEIEVSGHDNLTIVSELPKAVDIQDAQSVIKVTTTYHPTMGPLLEQVAHTYLPVHSKYFVC